MRGRFAGWIAENYWRFSPFTLVEKFEKKRFDQRHGVDTQRDVRLADLAIDSPNQRHGMRYHATPPLSFRRILKKLRVDFSDYTFVDFGSGKGLTLLLASDFAFKRIIGVEFSEQLHRQALSNIEQYKPQYHSPIESVHADAIRFALPDGALLLYFFNPFNDFILRQVLANIQRAATSAPRPVLVIYLYLENRQLIDEFPQFRTIFRWHKFDVLEVIPAG